MTNSALRRLIATLCLTCVLAAGLAVATLPWLRPDRLGIAAVFALALAVFAGGWRLWRKPHRAMLAVILAALALLPAAVIARAFGRIDMFAILFHADFGMQGATLVGLETEILQGIISCAMICLAIMLLSALWMWGKWPLLGAAIGLLAVNPVVQFGVLTVTQPAVVSDLSYQLATPRTLVRATTPDLIVIYLEGTDRQFADPAVWGTLYAPLTDLAAKGTSFTGVGQVAGTGWSLAGMVATQCGVPLVPRGLVYRNNFDDVAQFMPAVICLGDVLAMLGYRSAYVVGGDLEFGGIGAFYRTHGIGDVTGLVEQEATYRAQDSAAARIDWVLDDQMVFQTARVKQAQMLQDSRPYALIVETIGPHGRTGYLSRRCADDGKATKSTDVPRVIACTLAEMVAFVRDAEAAHAAAGRGRDLRFVILSDHLSHNGHTPRVAAQYDRANTVIFLGAAAEAGRVVSTRGAMIDVFPTLLDWLGFAQRPVAAGLGRSLLDDVPSLLETHGKNRFDRMLVGDAALAARLWAETAGQP